MRINKRNVNLITQIVQKQFQTKIFSFKNKYLKDLHHSGMPFALYVNMIR